MPAERFGTVFVILPPVVTHPFRDAIMSGMHLLKFGLLIVLPNALWVRATISANPTQSAWGTFGQVRRVPDQLAEHSIWNQTFAIAMAIGNIILLCVDAYELGREKLTAIFWAVVLSEEVKAKPSRIDVEAPFGIISSTH